MIELALLVGSAVAGWHSFFPWLAGPPLIIAFVLLRMRARLNAALRRNLGTHSLRASVARDMLIRSEITTFAGVTGLNTALFFAVRWLATFF